VTVRAAELTDADVIAHLLGELGYANRPDEVHDRLCRIAARPDAAVVAAMSAGGDRGRRQLPGHRSA